MSSIPVWIIVISVIIIIIAIAFGVGWYIRNNNNVVPPPNKYSAPLVWGTPTPGPNITKNTCQRYDFNTTVIEVDNIPTVVPGVPTFNEDILNNLQGNPNYPLCLDSDQIMARQLQHTCTAPNGVVDGQITRCLLLNGGTTGLGGSETYFSNSGCFKVPACAGELSLISINYQAPTVTDIYCLQSSGITGGNITIQPCNPSNPLQLFRVTRINPGQNPNTLIPGRGQNGLIAQILDRNTGLCVVPGTSSTETIYDPNYFSNEPNRCSGEISGCSGPTQIVPGQNIVLGSCTGGSFPGYIWALLPSVEYCGITGGCSGCNGCVGCNRISGTNTCGGCTGCTGFAPQVTPPQILDISNININNLPVGQTGYQGLTGTSAVVKYLLDNNTKAMYFGGTGSGLILNPMGTDSSVCLEKPFTPQYLNLSTYNTLIHEEICLANCLVNCVGL